MGGETLSIEVNVMPGKGKLQLTGQLGDIMKESAQAAFSYIRSHAEQLGIDPNFQDVIDVHVHIPEGATPKDGPSAGVALTLALFSAVSKRPVKAGLAMTGEVTLRGRVLAIGGLKEKLLAAIRAGIKTVLFPKANEKDLQEIPDYVKKRIEVIPVSHLDEVFGIAFDNAVQKTGPSANTKAAKSASTGKNGSAAATNGKAAVTNGKSAATNGKTTSAGKATAVRKTATVTKATAARKTATVTKAAAARKTATVTKAAAARKTATTGSKSSVINGKVSDRGAKASRPMNKQRPASKGRGNR
jgi:predicted S18 family serine protease